MDIDWVVAIGIFLVFLAWSFSYYLDLFDFGLADLSGVADINREKIVNFLSADVYRIPVKFYSENGTSGSVLKARGFWYSGEKNSTRVMSGNVYLQCEISGDDLYWEANLLSGNNYFYIEFANINTTRNCSASLQTNQANLTIPWVAERKKLVSMAKINNMTNTSYSGFKGILGIAEDFRIELNTSLWSTAYGKNLGGNVNRHVRSFTGHIWEWNQPINITIYIW